MNQRTIHRIAILTGLSFLFFWSCTGSNEVKPGVTADQTRVSVFTNSGVAGNYPESSPVSIHGKLKVIGTQLCDEQGKPVQLRGFSTHGLQWYGQFVNKDGIAWLAKNWKMDVFRAAMYTTEGGYTKNSSLAFTVKEAVDYTEASGIYCIIDWHQERDGDPNTYKKEAYKFFKQMSFLYGSKKHVIYEICNEPNGSDVNWEDKIKPYAEYVIPAIRSGDSNAIIIVGTGTWSQDVEGPADDPLKFDNIMYTMHFYAGTHKQSLRDRVDKALKKIAIFCTEWGTSDCTGMNGPFVEESEAWMKFLNDKKISWCNWSFSDAREDSAALKPNSKTSGGWDSDSLSPSGKFVRQWMSER